jgi:hypothetical protein
MQIVHTITESSGQATKLFNAAHVYSSLNRKMIAPVDNSGNAQAIALNIKVYSDAANTATFKTASNSYVTKQAIKSWYRVWRKNLSEAGVSLKDLGPYGRVFKPRLNASDTNFGSAGEAGRGTWNYTDMVGIPPSNSSSDSIRADDLVDQYTLSILGSSTADTSNTQDQTRQFVNVGMVESWLGSRKKPLGADDNTGGDSVDEDLVFDQDNPLLLARGNNLASEVMLDEIREMQKEEPPYTEADFTSAYTQALVKTNVDLSAECDIVAPCGLVSVTTTAACTVVFTLVGIGDM